MAFYIVTSFAVGIVAGREAATQAREDVREGKRTKPDFFVFKLLFKDLPIGFIQNKSPKIQNTVVL